MTKEDCIRKIAQRFYERRLRVNIPGTADADWKYATHVFEFLDNDDATRDTEWAIKYRDCKLFSNIYNLYKEGI